MNTAIVYVLASLGEIAGCISFWVWLRLGSPRWLLPSMTSLGLFAYLLTRIDSSTAGRAYAAYWSVYIVSSICSQS
jgi:small multidrug resistance family-3 protein